MGVIACLFPWALFNDTSQKIISYAKSCLLFTSSKIYKALGIRPTSRESSVDYSADMDPLIARAFHNQTQSAVCQLPEELLLDIMKLLELEDPASNQCLRRTCRLFLRLYSSMEFSEGHAIGSTETIFSKPWSETNSQRCSLSQWASLRDQDVDGYCKDCQRGRQIGTWSNKLAWLLSGNPDFTRLRLNLKTEYYHCSRCHIMHPKCLFSHDQRLFSINHGAKFKPNKRRICIGHQGYIRLCQHVSIQWKDIAEMVSILAVLDTGDNVSKIELRVCSSLDHAPRNHNPNSSHMHTSYMQPTIVIEGNNKRDIVVKLLWTGHLPLPKINNRQATPDFVSQHFTKFRQGAAECIAPEISPGRLMEMVCFDINKCNCLHYAGLEMLSSQWKLAPLERFKQSTCREHQDGRLAALWPEGNTAEEINESEGRAGCHYAHIQATGMSKHGLDGVTINVDPCPTGGSCLMVRYCRTITALPYGQHPGRVTTAWCQALDPDSYNLTDDHISVNTLWCWRKECRNYFRYWKPAFVPSHAAHRKYR
jgi:hypothetical protein